MRAGDLIGTYDQWVVGKCHEGFSPFMMSFMFGHIRGSDLTVRKEMEGAVSKLYSRALTRIIRNTSAGRNKHGWPVWIVVPDYPGSTWFKMSRSDVSINGGRHMHAIAMIPSRSRLKTRFDLHMLEHRDVYIRFPLFRIDVRPITDRIEHTVDYAMKGLKRQDISGDDILILPAS